MCLGLVLVVGVLLLLLWLRYFWGGLLVVIVLSMVAVTAVFGVVGGV